MLPQAMQGTQTLAGAVLKAGKAEAALMDSALSHIPTLGTELKLTTDTLLPPSSGVAGMIETHGFHPFSPTYVVPFHPALQGPQSIHHLNRVTVERQRTALSLGSKN